MCAYAISPARLGVDFEKTYTDGIAPFKPGEEILGSDGTTYKFVKFTGAKTKGLVYIIDNEFILQSGVSISGHSAAPLAVGVPQVDLSAPDAGETYAFGWVAVRGPLVLFAAGNTAANTELYTSSITGVLHSNVSNAKLVQGAKLTAAAGATASALTNAFATTFMTVPSDV